MPKRNNLKKKIVAEGKPCNHPGCDLQGEYPAPKSRILPESFRIYTNRDLSNIYEINEDKPGEKLWFCLGHIREFNSKWNFFDGMTGEEIDCFQFDAVSGHRMSWHASERTPKSVKMQQDADNIFKMAWKFRMGDNTEKPKENNYNKSHSELYALRTLELLPPVSFEEIKAQYRKLVKIHHPDNNYGNNESNEKIREITLAYGVLKSIYHPVI